MTAPPDGTVAPAALAFVVSNLRLLSLAAEPAIASPQNLLAPRVAITVLINVAQGLLAYTIQRLSAAQTSKDHKLKPRDETLQCTRSSSKAAVAEIEAVLQSMNPAWKDEIALLRSLISQIGVIDQVSEALTEAATTSKASIQARKRKAETWQDAQQRATWDHFLGVQPSANQRSHPSSPKMAFLMHVLADQHVSWDRKLDAVKTLFLARRNAAAPSLTLEKSLTAFYFELLVAAIEACAAVVEMPPAFKAAEVYATVWRHALCGMIPEIVLQLEQWLDARQDLPLRGQRLEAPHVRLEGALRAALLVMANVSTRAKAYRPIACADQRSGGTWRRSGGRDNGRDGTRHTAFAAHQGVAAPSVYRARLGATRGDRRRVPRRTQARVRGAELDAVAPHGCPAGGSRSQHLFETRIPSDDPNELLHRVASDPGTHYIFARQLVLQMQGWLEQHDLESIARWCKALSEDACEGGAILDTVMIYIDPTELLNPLASVLDHQDLGQTSDEPSTLSTSSSSSSSCAIGIPSRRTKSRASPRRTTRWTSKNPSASPSSTSTPPFLSTYLPTASACPPLSTLSEDEQNPRRPLDPRTLRQRRHLGRPHPTLASHASPPTLAPPLLPKHLCVPVWAIDLENSTRGTVLLPARPALLRTPGALAWLLGEVVRTPLSQSLNFSPMPVCSRRWWTCRRWMGRWQTGWRGVRQAGRWGWSAGVAAGYGCVSGGCEGVDWGGV